MLSRFRKPALVGAFVAAIATAGPVQGPAYAETPPDILIMAKSIREMTRAMPCSFCSGSPGRTRFNNR